jgi:response regulator RpfG family c-di-GMP phosphodiesterase
MMFIRATTVGPSARLLRYLVVCILVVIVTVPCTAFTVRQFIERTELLRDEARIFTNFIDSGLMRNIANDKQEQLLRTRDKIFLRQVSIVYTHHDGAVFDALSVPIETPTVSVTTQTDSGGKIEFITSVSDRMSIIKQVWLVALSLLLLVIYFLVKTVFARWRVAEKDEITARQNLEDIVNLSSDWFWETNQDGTVTRVLNKKNIFLNTASLEGTKIWQSHYLDPIESSSTVQAKFALREHLSFTLKISEQNSTHWHRVKAAPAYTEHGEFRGYKGAGLDITSEYSYEQKISQLQEVVIQAMGSLAETRDNETGHHIIRTKYYVKELALELRNYDEFSNYIDDTYIGLLVLSAPLHDIGKVGIPDSILCKPGKLTSEEFEIMKTHTTLGYEAIERAEQALGLELDFLTHAKDIALYHQEKWDGSGYPMALVGIQIPLSARLMALADVYDALISRRVYKPPFSHEKAVQIITEGRDKHFDPRVVDAFLTIQERFRQIAAEYADPE